MNILVRNLGGYFLGGVISFIFGMVCTPHIFDPFSGISIFMAITIGQVCSFILKEKSASKTNEYRELEKILRFQALGIMVIIGLYYLAAKLYSDA